MKTLIVFAHPNRKSFNGTILDIVLEELNTKGWQYRVTDLYEDNFSPILSQREYEESMKNIYANDVKRHQEDIQWAKNIIFIYPIWWMSTPAILKGWIDRVFAMGFAYGQGQNGLRGLLKDKKAIFITTSGHGQKEMIESGMINAMEKIHIEGTMNFCGIYDVTFKNLGGAVRASNEEHKEMLGEVRKLIRNI